MDLFNIARRVWRYKLITLPVIVLTIFAAAYVMAVKKPLYEATSSYLLINPPAPPTAEEVARNPALGRIRTDNPFTRFADQGVVIDVLARTMSTDAARRTLVRAGADPAYRVEGGATFGTTSPIVQITGTGTSPDAAMRTAEVVSHAVVGELDRLQKEQEVDPRYRITARHVEGPDGAQLQASGQLRMLIAVLALGTIALFVVVSITEGLSSLQRERRIQYALPSEEWAILDHEPDLAPTARTNGNGNKSGTGSPTSEHTA